MKCPSKILAKIRIVRDQRHPPALSGNRQRCGNGCRSGAENKDINIFPDRKGKRRRLHRSSITRRAADSKSFAL
jgi:hypothetical protein